MYTGPSCGVDVAKLGKGFRVQNIVSLMRVCYKWLEDAHKARLHVVSISVFYRHSTRCRACLLGMGWHVHWPQLRS